MTFRKIVGLTFALLVSVNTWADELDINPQHPEQYTVMKDDTLWDISAKFLKSPWKWHKLWHNNTQIKNPNLIYPGDTLVFSVVNGQPRLRFAGGESGGVSGEVKLHPHIRKESLPNEIKTIPTDAIAQFLSSPKVLDTDKLDSEPYVVDFKGEHLITGAGDRLYVRGLSQIKGLEHTVYRKGQPYINPETGEVLGFEALHIADVTLEKEGDPMTFVITQSEQEIRLGDRVMPASEKTAPLNYFPQPPTQNINGNIVGVLNGLTQIGRNNIVVIDKGLRENIKVGHLLSVYHKGKIIADPFKTKDEVVMVKLPNEVAGTVMIFRVFERVSYALVLEANQAMHVLDKVGNPENY
jgi:LysM domain